MRFLDRFLEKFPTPRQIREREAEIQARRTSQASQWATRYFPVEMRRAATSVAFALCEIECLDTAMFDPNSRLIEDLKMTDLEPAQVVMHSEKEFGIQIPDSDAEKLATVSQWVHYLHERA
ncbi:MAG TPA: phosphopantetheine-binding protein [Verrucomicrobiae bacterium]|jgi:acyl carrier protein